LVLGRVTASKPDDLNWLGLFLNHIQNCAIEVAPFHQADTVGSVVEPLMQYPQSEFIRPLDEDLEGSAVWCLAEYFPAGR